MLRARDEFKQELQCEMCGGAMKILAPIHPPDTTQRILECLRLPSRPPPPPRRLFSSARTTYNCVGAVSPAWTEAFQLQHPGWVSQALWDQAICAGFIRFKHGGLPVEGRNKVRGHTSAKAVSLAVTIRQFRGVSFRRAGAIGGGREGRPRESRILRATDGSSIAARSIPNDLSNLNCLPTQVDGTSRSDFE